MVKLVYGKKLYTPSEWRANYVTREPAEAGLETPSLGRTGALDRYATAAAPGSIFLCKKLVAMILWLHLHYAMEKF